MPDLTVSTAVDNLMASADQAGIRTSVGLGATDTVEFGGLETTQFNFPNLTTSELNAVADAIEGDTYFDSDRNQFVRFTGASSYDVITSRSYQPILETTQGTALTLPDSRLFESGVFAGSPDVFSPSDLLLVYPSKNPSSGTPTSYLYHTGEQGPVGWYDANDVNGGVITSTVFTPDTLMQLQLSGSTTPFVFNNYAINTITPINLASADLKAASTYSFDFKVSFIDLQGSNVAVTADYDGLLDSGGFLSFSNTDTQSKAVLFDTIINSPDVTTKLTLNTGAFAGVNGSTLGIWEIGGTLTPTTDGTLTIKLGQNTADVDPLFYSSPSMNITLLSD